ncbi:broad specificity phosphatase PhoE [Mycobacterium frederiksbergense]|uniref:Broad specificity phosphatase PhoE n=1 Tax=Mycolicibacterium frederiksbergense TaxID=117567 RepID=A0ABT6KZA5_9MYCO|nr:histidine phosphatase family protein [Mycolicibacterium frederiksbergense]MDH6196033.1 broad specificity phosphatase PhoE [Mycolicibacterium frederiksbergense]
MNDPSDPDAVTSPDTGPVGRRRRTVVRRFVVAMLASIGLLVGAAIPAAAAELMRVTFIRHGESFGNTSGLIDTSTPGPGLTPKGEQQAKDIAAKLGDNNYDAIYASTMVRTQQTAIPMSQNLRLPIQVLPGLQEIEAGVFEGTPEANASRGYGLFPIGWALTGVIPQIPADKFNKGTFMPGTDVNGYVFDARVRGALQTMYDNGDRNAVVFSHGGTIMFWTLMNVNNLTVMQKLDLLQNHQLGNTDYVVIEGNNEDGWTLVNWNGKEYAPEPTLGAEVKLQMRTLTRQLAAAAQQVKDAFATGDIRTIATAINRSVADATFSVAKFNRAVTAKVIHEVGQALDGIGQAISPKTPAPAPTDISALKSAADNAVADNSAAGAAPSAKSVTDTVKRFTSSKPKAPEADVATKLKDGNMAVPGKPDATPARPGQQLQDAVKDVSNQVSNAIQKLGGIGKKKTAGTAGAGTSSDAGSGDSGSQHKDAA